MVRVHDIMSVEVITVSPADTLREAAEELASSHISGLPVVEGGEVVGVISATDLLEFSADASGPPMERRTGTRGFEDLPDLEAWREGDEAPASYFVDMWENAGAELGRRLQGPDRPEWNVLEEHTVAELMTRTLVALPPEADARDAARKMLRADVHRLLVVDDGKLVGMVTTVDIMKAVSQHGLAG